MFRIKHDHLMSFALLRRNTHDDIKLWPFKLVPIQQPIYAQNKQEDANDDADVVHVARIYRQIWREAEEDGRDADEEDSDPIACSSQHGTELERRVLIAELRENLAAADDEHEDRQSDGNIEEDCTGGHICVKCNGWAEVEESEAQVEDVAEEDGFERNVESFTDAAEAVERYVSCCQEHERWR